MRNSPGSTDSPKSAPAALEMLSSISVPEKSLAPACRHASAPGNPSFTQDTCRFGMCSLSRSRANACTIRCSSSVAPARAWPLRNSRVFSCMKPSGTNSVKPPVSFWMSRSSSMWRTQCSGCSVWPYIMVEVEGMPSPCAVQITSIQRETFSLLGLRSPRTSSSRISAAVPGMLPMPASLSEMRCSVSESRVLSTP